MKKTKAKKEPLVVTHKTKDEPLDTIPEAEDEPRGGIRLVGIGASAGGLEALRELMESLPDSDVLTYVIAQHVSPTHISMLMNLLAPKTALRVQDLTDGQIPAPGAVYITPPNKDVILEGGLLCLTEPQQAVGPKPSVNHFFHSLADGLGEQAIGIILSGTGTDGAAGLRAIKAAGGYAIAQEPDSAKYDGMPKAAIHTGCVDLILRPSEIGPALDRLLTANRDTNIVLDVDTDSDEYTQITNLVRLSTAFRLSDYKAATVHRRIARRMNIMGIRAIRDYVEYLRTNKQEALALVRDTFISVTSFFRDEHAFLALERVVKSIVIARQNSSVIRCWVAGCATGEEAYSIAMLFEEALLTAKRSDLQYMIFASDLDDDALVHARNATYSINEIESIPALLRDRYTENVGSFFRVHKNLRNRVVFARQNVIEDPPFARQDLITCRNLLIYLNPPVQKRVMEVFHYSLSPGGHLFLGKSESTDQHKDLFKALDNRARLYTRLEGISHYSMPMTQGTVRPQEPIRENERVPASTDLISMRTLEGLSERYAPASLVINDADAIVHFHGNLKPFLRFPKGRADMYLFDLLETGVRAELRALVFRCRRDQQVTRGGSFELSVDGELSTVIPVVAPLEAHQSQLLLVSFETRPASGAHPVARSAGEVDARDSLIIGELEQELANTRSHLNVVVEELETSNEELQSLNEELQSTNEELQSTNEELQTSNEELQSTNEELLTVNEELQVKSAELETTATDLTNVKQSLAFPLIVVDSQLMITQANKACSAIVEIDAPLEHSSLNSIQWRIELPGLVAQVRRVIGDGKQLGLVVAGERDEAFRLHVMPYRNVGREIAGAVMLFEDISAQQRSEIALKESEEKFREAMVHAPIGMALVASDGRWLDVNPMLCDLLGYSPDELVKLNLQAVSHPNDYKQQRQYIVQMTSGEIEVYQLEKRYIHKDGQIIWAQLNVSAVRDRSGEVRYFIYQIEDIRERREASETMARDREQQSVLRAMLESTLKGIDLNDGLQKGLGQLFEVSWLGEPAQGGVFLTQKDESSLKLTVAHKLPVEIQQICSELPFGRCYCGQAAATGCIQGKAPLGPGLEIDYPGKTERPHYCLPLMSKDVALGVLLLVLPPETEVDADKEQFLATAADILASFIERKQGEERLRKQENMYRSVAETSKDGFWILDCQGRLVEVNDAYTYMSGYSREELLAMRIGDIEAIENREETASRIEKIIATGFDLFETIHRTKDGGKISVEVNVSYWPEDGGRFFVFIRDISERQRQTSELLRLSKDAEAANEAKSRFLATMSHEIRTPLNAVLGMAQLLLAPNVKDEERIDSAHIILDSGQTLLSLLDDILDLSKIEAGKQELRYSAFQPTRLLQEVAELYRQRTHQRNLKMDVVWQGDEIACTGDEQRIRQILSNLVSNAIKFTSQGHVELSGRWLNNSILELSVSDTGIGIPASRQAELFQPFKQIDSGNTRVYGGSGLGLSIVHGLVNLMGGEVGLESQPGKGSRFFVRIPVTLETSPSVKSGPQLRDDPATTLAPLGVAAHVLVVEDYPANALLMERFGAVLGIKLSLAQNGRDAVDAVQADPSIELVLMDIHMPVLDGYEATKQIRLWEKTNRSTQLPIIALTANAYAKDRELALQAGMNDFLSKPIDIRSLKETLVRWLPRLAPMNGTTPQDTRDIDLPRVVKLVDDILPLLGDGKFDAVPLVKHLAREIAGTKLEQAFSEVSAAVGKLDFKQATKLMKRFANLLK